MDATNRRVIPYELSDGRMLAPHGDPEGRDRASDVQVTEAEVAAAEAGHIDLSEPASSPFAEIGSLSIEKVLERVGEDDDLRAQALAAERARGDDARSTLIDKLEAPST